MVALNRELTVAEISKRYNAPESVVRLWRREGLGYMTDDFNAKNSNDKTGNCDSEEKIAMLERKVGQLWFFHYENTNSFLAIRHIKHEREAYIL